jgi:hypothetical protein
MQMEQERTPRFYLLNRLVVIPLLVVDNSNFSPRLTSAHNVSGGPQARVEEREGGRGHPASRQG